MTYNEHQQVAVIEQTCDEVRRENEELRAHISFLRHSFGEIYKLNSLGKTKKLAELVWELRK